MKDAYFKPFDTMSWIGIFATWGIYGGIVYLIQRLLQGYALSQINGESLWLWVASFATGQGDAYLFKY